MGQLLKVLFYAIAILFVYLIFAGLYKSCNSKKAELTAIENTVDGDNTSDDFEENTSEFFEEDEDEEIDYGSSETEEVENADDLFEEVEDTNYEEESDDVEESTYTPPARTNSNNSGSYLVIAGTFGSKSNAEKMVSKLRDIGYDGAEYLVFDNSSYYSVTAGRFSSKSNAAEVVQILQRNRIESYVHRRQN